ncbi:hypothetical protein D3C75_837430 [compost metagenome]
MHSNDLLCTQGLGIPQRVLHHMSNPGDWQDDDIPLNRQRRLLTGRDPELVRHCLIMLVNPVEQQDNQR